MRGPFVSVFRHEGGQSIVELALAVPILIFALIGGIDLMRVAAIQQAVQNAARSGAEVIGQNSKIGEDAVLNAISGELDKTPGLRGARVGKCTQQSGAPPSPSPCASLPPAVSFVYQGTLKDGTTSCPSNSAGLCFVRVEVLYRFNTIVPWPYVPNVITVDRGTSMPILR